MIPKIIHYCWFGRGELPSLAKKCIASWEKYLPNYELKLWNEDNFNINSNSFVKEAYQSKKYAFVTDYVRLYALYNEGGIYMDTDVEVLKNLDIFLCHPAFSGFENDTQIPTGIMGSMKHGEWVKWQLEYYKDRHFILENGKTNMITNVSIISDSMEKEGFILKNSYQNFKDIITIYPKDYFCPKSYIDGKIYITKNTYCIHHFAGSWIPKKEKVKKKIFTILGKQVTGVIVRVKHLFLKK